MVERQDIDALLISALYGELTPADEARLAAHLASHPADRSALDGLTHARSLVRDSQIAAAQVEPPQALSALLLQEASRSAPRRAAAAVEAPRESWLFRFVRTFASQPAMAAAAMLVLVVGAAGVLKMRERGELAEAPVESSVVATRAPVTAADNAPSAVSGGAGGGGPGAAPAIAAAAPSAAGSAAMPADVTVQLADAPDHRLALDGKLQAANGVDQLEGTKRQRGRAELEAQASGETYKADDSRRGGDLEPNGEGARGDSQLGKKGILVTTPGLALKDADGNADQDPAADKGAESPRQPERVLDRAAPTVKQERGGEPTGAAFATSAQLATPAPSAAPPPPPAPPSKSSAHVSHGAGAPAPVSNSVARDEKKPAAVPPAAPPVVTANAREQAPADPALTASLKQVVELTRAGRCDDAAKAAGAISQRAPAFYASQVATNIDLKKCMTYIAAEERAVEQKRAAAKAKATASDADKK